MRVAELIQELKKYPKETPVCVHDGLDPSDPSLVKSVELKHDREPIGVWEPYLFIQ